MWIYGIARNIVANRRRAAARSMSLLERARRAMPGDDQGPEAVVVRRSEYEQLDRALARLPRRYRETLILGEWDGLDRESIARLEGVSRSAIDQRISRGYRKLARSMNSRSPNAANQKVFTVPRRTEEGR
jgi:RNA polymerase sigma factor (sigma-70 family)